MFQDFKAPKRPFKRMEYKDAITYLKEHDIRKDDGTFYEFGEVMHFNYIGLIFKKLFDPKRL